MQQFGSVETVASAIFSFGTLQLEQVQRALFGRTVVSTPDALRGYRVGELRIVDPEVVAASGKDIHPALLHTGDHDDVVHGAVLDTDEAELAAADHYERVSFRRIPVVLESGTDAWAYVPR